MIYLLIADNKTFRAEKIADIFARFENSELIQVDDTTLALSDLERFLFPSLFSVETTIVLSKFLLEGETYSAEFIKKLVASPTVFVFEEMDLSSASRTIFQKAGAIVHIKEKEKRNKPSSDLFSATKCITEKDKKSRWLAYRSAVEIAPIEAILGILYWKIRSLAVKAPAGNDYEKLYGNLLEAQARAWKNGIPLEAAVEKVILAY